MKKVTVLFLIIIGFVFLSSCNESLEDVYYSIVFVDQDDNILKTENVLEGNSATAPNAPDVEGFKFIEWDKDYSNVSSDLTVKATYIKDSKESYTVVFYNIDNEVINYQTVVKGNSATAAIPPTIRGYDFISWDKDFDNVRSDLKVYPIYEIKQYEVSFISNEEVVSLVTADHGSDVTAPTLERPGYEFLKWDKDYSKVESDLTIKAVWKRLIQASYLSSFEFVETQNYLDLLTNIKSSINLQKTIKNIKDGGFRGTNELVYYNNPSTHNTNIYGFEVAVDKHNIVVEMATKVEMPLDGFVLSAHGTGIDKLDSNINLGDYLVYNNNEIKIYRNNEVSEVIGLGIELERLKEEINLKDQRMSALDYQLIQNKYNESATIYNDLINNYSLTLLNVARELVLSIDYLLIEPSSTKVRAMWHYPLRSTGYPENNTFEVKRYLDKVKKLGINRVYLLTNFHGSSIYKSEHLQTRLTQNNTYDGYKDYLECFIAEAHKREIEVFAWTTTLIAGDGRDNPFYSSKGWLTKGYNNEDNSGRMYYLDISNNEAMSFLQGVFNELATNYNLDGIEYDFIRFPSGNAHNYKSGDDTASLKDWGYTESFINRFMDEYNLSGDLKELVKNNDTVRNNWLEFKKDVLTEVVEMLTTTIKEANPNIKVTAAVMPKISSAKNVYLQDWEKWIKAGLVEELNPMIYTADNNNLSISISNMKEIVQDYADIVAGIYPEGSGGADYMIAQQISILEELNIYGVSRFSSRLIFSTKALDAISYMNRSYIVLPSASNKEIIDAYIYDLKEKIINYYNYKVDDQGLIETVELISSLSEDINPLDVINNIRTKLELIENEVINKKLLKENSRIKKYIQS